MNIFLSIALFIALTVSPADNENGLIEKAKKLHESIVTIDTHVDTPLRLMRGFDISIKNNSGQVDFPRMKEGGMDGVFFAVFIGQGPLTDSAYAYEKEHALNIFTEIHESVSASEDQAELAYTADDILSIEKKGKRAVYIGIENGYPIGKDIDLINKFYELGARYITLSHSHDNQICGSSTDRETKNSGGLTEFGRRVVNRMNQLGIMVDISHVSDDTFNDVIDVSTAPVIASHSCARTLCDYPRNLSDDMLKKLAEKNGVIQICLYSNYIKDLPSNPKLDSAYTELRKSYPDYRSLPEDEKKKVSAEWERINELYPPNLATVSDLVDHIDYIKNLIGIDHVGIGSDFDGGAVLADLKDMRDMWKITYELLKRDYTEEQIAKIWGLNLLRVMRAVENVALIN